MVDPSENPAAVYPDGAVVAGGQALDTPPPATEGLAEGRSALTLVAEHVSAWYGESQAIGDMSPTIKPNQVTALIGPSGCGKSTFRRCLNRLHEVTPRGRVAGQVLLDGQDIYDPRVDPVRVRRVVGMIVQKPAPFPTMSIYDNIVAGLRLNGLRKRARLDAAVERCLRAAALWDEVAHRLKDPGVSLSGGQQQRQCIARALAIEPEVLLMDEPCSALDPLATYRIEDLITTLKRDYTVALVTHNMQQAARVADWTAFLLADNAGVGRLVEYGQTRQIFTNPTDRRTEEYLTGRFG